MYATLCLPSPWPGFNARSWRSQYFKRFFLGWSHSASPSRASVAENGLISPQWKHITCGHRKKRPKSNHGLTMPEIKNKKPRSPEEISSGNLIISAALKYPNANKPKARLWRERPFLVNGPGQYSISRMCFAWLRVQSIRFKVFNTHIIIAGHLLCVLEHWSHPLMRRPFAISPLPSWIPLLLLM